MATQPNPAAIAAAREPLESHIRRFARGYRRRLRKLAKTSPRLGELLYTFPGAAVTLVAGNRMVAERQTAVNYVKRGLPLAAVAEALALPMWMKRLPPEAYSDPLPRLPDDAEFSRRIANFPRAGENVAMWLRWIVSGAEACDLAFAEWLAHQKIFDADDDGAAPLLPLAAFAWFSAREDLTACGLMARPWRSHMGFRSAVQEAQAWLERIIMEYCREDTGGLGNWHRPHKVCGYRFIPLLTPQDLQDEGERMHHCVAAYAGAVARGTSLIYSIRRGGQRIATMEVRAAYDRSGAGIISQLQGPRNADASEDVRRAASAWLAKQGKCPLSFAQGGMSVPPVRAEKWEAIWRPYWTEKLQIKSALEKGDARTLIRLRNDVNALMRLAK